MNEIEKLRALLAEARGGLQDRDGTLHDVSRCVCWGCNLSRRIDAALAVPSVDWRKAHADALAELSKTTEERDEALAEVEQIRALCVGRLAAVFADGRVEGYRRGAETMREAAASCVGSDPALLQTYRSVLEGRIRDLPLPKDT